MGPNPPRTRSARAAPRIHPCPKDPRSTACSVGLVHVAVGNHEPRRGLRQTLRRHLQPRLRRVLRAADVQVRRRRADIAAAGDRHRRRQRSEHHQEHHREHRRHPALLAGTPAIDASIGPGNVPPSPKIAPSRSSMSSMSVERSRRSRAPNPRSVAPDPDPSIYSPVTASCRGRRRTISRTSLASNVAVAAWLDQLLFS
jgi:hypothetical protein